MSSEFNYDYVFDKYDLKDKIRIDLGQPVVPVQLKNGQIDNQIQKQLLHIQNKQTYIDSTMVEYKKGVDEIFVRDEKGRHISGISKIQLSNSNLHLLNQRIFSIYMSGQIEDIVQTMSYINGQRNILSFERRWRFDRDESSIKFTTNLDRDGYQVIWYFYVPKLEDLKDSDLTWVYEYQLQESKIMLGRIRQSINGMQTSVGQFNYDSQSLISEGNNEKQDLLNQLKEKKSIHIKPVYYI